MKDRVDRLIAAAAACLTCGEEHTERKCDCDCCKAGRVPLHSVTWASTVDGHAYRKSAISVYWLREWAEKNP